MNALFDRRQGAGRRDLDIETASPDELRAYVCELESLLDAIREPASAPMMLKAAFPGLTGQTAHLLAILSDGRIHSKEAILSRLYAGRADDPPEIKIVDVFLCKLRGAVAEYGVEIVTHWGAGMQVSAGLDAVRAAIESGETQPLSDNPVAAPRAAKNAGDRPTRYPMTAATAALRIIAGRSDWRGDVPPPPIEITAREYAAAWATTTQFSTVVRRLEEIGHVAVFAEPKRHKNGATPWRLALTPNGVARARELGFLPAVAA